MGRKKLGKNRRVKYTTRLNPKTKGWLKYQKLPATLLIERGVSLQKQLMSRPLKSDLDEAKRRIKLLVWGNEDEPQDVLAALIELKIFCDAEYKKLIEADPDYSPSILRRN